jgi:hypothetical protein
MKTRIVIVAFRRSNFQSRSGRSLYPHTTYDELDEIASLGANEVFVFVHIPLYSLLVTSTGTDVGRKAALGR